tara:strand:- start:6546 stop:6761 length:216 start_codon:yes stop_codon:yes gene_type:complete
MRDNEGSDNSISGRGLIEFYEKLLNNGNIQIGGSAHNRLKLLKEQFTQRDNKYYKAIKRSVYNKAYKQRNK